MQEEKPLSTPRLAKLQAAKEAALHYRLKEPEIVDGFRGPSPQEALISIEDIIPDPETPSWLFEKFDDPSKVVIFQSKNPGLILSLKRSRTFYDADMTKQEEPGAMANFAKTGGFFATDDPELIKIIKNSGRYGSEYWDVRDAKKAAQEQNFQAFAADMADDPKLLERLVNENPEKIRMLFRKLGVKSSDTFEEASAPTLAPVSPETPPEAAPPEAPPSQGPPSAASASGEGDDFG